MRAFRTRAAVAVLPALSALLLVAPARAAQIPGATYNGTHYAGGAVQLVLTPDGRIASFSFRDVPAYGWCPFAEGTQTFDPPIGITSDHSFGYSLPGGAPFFNIQGTFSSAQGVEGKFSALYGVGPVVCGTVGPPGSGSGSEGTEVPFTATTTAVPPPPDTDGDGVLDPVDACPTTRAYGPNGCPDAVDKTPPSLRLSGQRRWKAGKPIELSATCASEACTAMAGGTVNVPAAAKTYWLKGSTAELAKGVETTLALKLPANAKSAIARALRKHKRVTAKVSVTVRDVAANFLTRSYKIRLVQ
jgi:hypothetical protein